MDRTLRRLTSIILLALAVLAWFEESLFGEDKGLLRVTVGILCIYVLLLVLERQRLEDKFMQLLATLKNIKTGAASVEDHVDGAKTLEAVSILIAALGSVEAEVRNSAEENLKRLTGKDFGADAKGWQGWLEAAREAAARQEPAAGNS